MVQSISITSCPGYKSHWSYKEGELFLVFGFFYMPNDTPLVSQMRILF